MDATDFQICREVIDALFNNYANKNYLFLEPVDLAYFPDYTSLVKRPMDLGTAKNNLHAGMYHTKESFFLDVGLCFENAAVFHKDKPENAWIIKFAKDMKKYLERERKRAEKKAIAAAMGVAVTPSGSATGGSGSGGGAISASAAVAKTPGASKKPKLKLSMKKKKVKAVANASANANGDGSGSGSSSVNAPAAGGSAGGSGSAGAGAAATGASSTKISKKKLSLKIKTKASSSGAASTPATPASTTSASASVSASGGATPKSSSTPQSAAAAIAITAPISVSTSSSSAFTKTSAKISANKTPAKTPAASTKKKPKFKLKLSSKKATAAAAAAAATTKKGASTPKGGSSGTSTSTSINTNTNTNTGSTQLKISTKKSSNASTTKKSVSTPKGSTPKGSSGGSSAVPSNSSSKSGEIATATAKSSASLSSSSSAAATATEKKSTKKDKDDSSSSSSKKDKKQTSTPKNPPRAPSRGKELPAPVAEAKAAKNKEYRKTANEKKAALAAEAKKESGGSGGGSSSSNGGAGGSSSTTVATSAAAITAKTPITNKGKEKSKASASPSASAAGTNKKIRLSLKSSASASTTKKTKASSKSPSPINHSGVMTPDLTMRCYKILSGLKRVEYFEISWFLKPVRDARLLEEYKAKIKTPMDLGTMTSKLDKNMYPKISDFVLDLRKIFGNCLRFNAMAGDSFRPCSISMAQTSEDLMNLFLPKTKKPMYKKLLYCWKKCLEIIDDALTLKNPDDGYPTVHYFLHPVSFYFGGVLPPDYLGKVKNPSDFGTITSKLLEGVYQNVEAFVSDCRMITYNCKTYYEGRSDGVMFVAQAARLEEFLSPKLDAILSYDASLQGTEDRKAALKPPPMALSRTPTTFMLSLLQALRNATYNDKITKLTEPAARQFESPVDTTYFPDYPQFVTQPMDLQTVERNVQSGKYTYPEDFEQDVNLIFRNCEAYNVPKRNDHIVNLARYCSKTFRRLYSQRIRVFQSSGGKLLFGEEKKDSKKRPLSTTTSTSSTAPQPKKMRKSPVNVGGAAAAPVAAVASKKAPTPVISIQKPKAKSKPKPKAPKKALPRIIIRTDGPLPLHVAIAKIKQEFSMRRPHKDLTLGWEGACSRFYRELKRHPWISTSKRFIFDAPVPMLHPEIKQAYAAVVKHPMDLTTAESKLLQGGLYNSAQEFVNDISLVFANAVTFNKAGREQGDPTSCAYFDASQHLLRYSRWLSMELISQFLVDDGHTEGAAQTGPISQWNLTTSNQRDARKEMEEIVMQHDLDRSEEGDRYTWMESECEKLLKSLRHQSDNKRMSFFLQPNYPADYFGYISKPMAWETCHRRLQQRLYKTMGEVASDLRLIFSNALKYNGRMKDKDPVSLAAYDSAVVMSGKLEVAIQRMLVSVADRIEREKVEEIVLGREQEIARKNEEERLKKEWQEERERGVVPGSRAQMAPTTNQTVKIISRRKKQEGLDFEFPFYDEETPYQQSEMDVLDKQKMMYEKQQLERAKMGRTSIDIGYQVYDRLIERTFAIDWAKKLTVKVCENMNLGKAVEGKESKVNPKITPASMVGLLLGKPERKEIKLCLASTKNTRRKKKKRPKACLFLD